MASAPLHRSPLLRAPLAVQPRRRPIHRSASKIFYCSDKQQEQQTLLMIFAGLDIDQVVKVLLPRDLHPTAAVQIFSAWLLAFNTCYTFERKVLYTA